MPFSSLDVCEEALRAIGVLAVDEEASSSDHARAKVHLSAIYEEIQTVHSAAPSWTIETVPGRAFVPLAKALAGSICTAYGQEAFAEWRGAGIQEVIASERKTNGEPLVLETLRQAGVIGANENPMIGDYNRAFAVVAKVTDEFRWSPSAVPVSAFDDVAKLAAATLAPLQAPESRHRVLTRIRARLQPDDRDDRSDLDGDGTISEGEESAAMRATYY